MVTGVILAGGCSTRAQTNKLLLEVEGRPLILHVIDSIKPFVDRLVVVTGKYDQELRPYLKDVEVIYNNNYELGMFSSVLVGIKNVDSDVLILPGDMMNISSNTFKSILTSKGVITIPTYKGQNGHPLFLNKDMRELLKKEDINSNLKAFVKRNIELVNYVEVNDPFIKFDVDTMQDYKTLLERRKELSYES